MKTYVQFYKNSTGYIEGSIPPKYSKDSIQPIEACGSDGVLILDGRNTLQNMMFNAERILNQRNRNGQNFTGYKIIKAQRFTDKGTVLISKVDFIS